MFGVGLTHISKAGGLSPQRYHTHPNPLTGAAEGVLIGRIGAGDIRGALVQ